MNLGQLRMCARWVADLLGRRERHVDDDLIVAALTRARDTSALVAMSPVELHAWLRRHGLFGKPCEQYVVERRRLLASDPEARRTPSRGAIPQWMRHHGVRDRFEMMGRAPVGKGSGKAKRRSEEYHLYDNYEEAKRAARAGEFADIQDYRERHKAHDPRLPSNPDVEYREAFRRDGWLGFLGIGAARSEIAGLVRAGRARKVLGIGHARFKRLFAPLEREAPRFPRRDGAIYFFAPEAIVEVASAAGAVGSDAREVLRELRAVAEPAV